MREGQYDVNQQRMGQLGTLAALTAPHIVQTGGSGTTSGTSSGTGTQTQSGGLLGDVLISLAGGAGTAAT